MTPAPQSLVPLPAGYTAVGSSVLILGKSVVNGLGWHRPVTNTHDFLGSPWFGAALINSLLNRIMNPLGQVGPWFGKCILETGPLSQLYRDLGIRPFMYLAHIFWLTMTESEPLSRLF